MSDDARQVHSLIARVRGYRLELLSILGAITSTIILKERLVLVL